MRAKSEKEQILNYDICTERTWRSLVTNLKKNLGQSTNLQITICTYINCVHLKKNPDTLDILSAHTSRVIVQCYCF